MFEYDVCLIVYQQFWYKHIIHVYIHRYTDIDVSIAATTQDQH